MSNDDSLHGGMTVNERLAVMNLLDEWDEAARARNRSRMMEIMNAVGLGDAFAAGTVDTVLANPELYGF